MKKVLLAFIMAAFVLAAVGCGQSSSQSGSNISTYVNSDNNSEGDTNNAYNTDDESSNVTATDEATEETVPEDETDPAVDATKASGHSQQGAVDISEISGVWSPQKVESAASGAEVKMAEAFGSAYTTYGGSLNISDDGSFTLNMGVYSYSGNITLSADGLQVQYDDNSTDVYDCIAYDDGFKVIKARVNDYFVYFV